MTNPLSREPRPCRPHASGETPERSAGSCGDLDRSGAGGSNESTLGAEDDTLIDHRAQNRLAIGGISVEDRGNRRAHDAMAGGRRRIGRLRYAADMAGAAGAKSGRRKGENEGGLD